MENLPKTLMWLDIVGNTLDNRIQKQLIYIFQSAFIVCDSWCVCVCGGGNSGEKFIGVTMLFINRHSCSKFHIFFIFPFFLFLSRFFFSHYFLRLVIVFVELPIPAVTLEIFPKKDE